jgi:hypothetical protein
MPETPDLPPSTPPTEDCGCDCGCDDDAVQSTEGEPGIDPSAEFSDSSIRYYDGTVKVTLPELTSAGYGASWGQTLSWSNTAGYAPYDLISSRPIGANGTGTVVTQLPYVLTANNFDTAVLVTNATNARFFDHVKTTPTPQFFVPDQLGHDTAAQEFLVTDTKGAQLHFYDFNTATGRRWGKFKSSVDAAGNVTAITSWTSDDRPAEVQRTTPAGATPQVRESYLYSYVSSGVNQGLTSNVTLRRQTAGSTSWTVVRSVDYVYYDATEPNNGNAGDLKTATVKDANGNPLDTTYFRYYPRQGTATSPFDGLKYVFNPPSYARLVAAVGNLAAAPDTQVAPYADRFWPMTRCGA